jgi:hypothetical protein
MFAGCTTSSHSSENKIDNEIYLDEIKREIYQEAFAEGYRAAADAIIDEMPWYVVDLEELEASLYMIFDDDAYAEEIRDQILSYCEIYERTEFDPSDSKSNFD